MPAGPFGILGAGGQAREVADFAGVTVAFFAVDAPHVASARRLAGDVPVIELPGGDEHRTIPVIAALGAPGARRAMVARWSGSEFTRAISSMAYVAGNVSLGVGTMIAPAAVVMAGVAVGDHALINAGATVGHDTVLEDYGTVSPGARVAGHCRIGAGAFIGIGAVVTQGVRIGEGAVIGAGAVVRHDVDPFEVHVGVPARVLRIEKEWLSNV